MKKFILIGLVLFLITGCLESAEEYCIKTETNEKLSISEAKEIAMNSECGSLTGESFCNEVTGTWWLDLELKKEGCNPACVVNVETKTAEINWRCTGAIP